MKKGLFTVTAEFLLKRNWWINGYATCARLTKCATPILNFIVIVFPIHLYALSWTDCHVECIIIAVNLSLETKSASGILHFK